jgi:phosphonate C-P lyase system protein PhnG
MNRPEIETTGVTLWRHVADAIEQGIADGRYPAGSRLPGETGFAYVLGRDPKKAKLIAVCDALIQSKESKQVVDAVIAPLEAALQGRRQQVDAETAATRVNFFTLVRGEG